MAALDQPPRQVAHIDNDQADDGQVHRAVHTRHEPLEPTTKAQLAEQEAKQRSEEELGQQRRLLVRALHELPAGTLDVPAAGAPHRDQRGPLLQHGSREGVHLRLRARAVAR